ncbi:hypothetical protein PAXRUDRAFT_36221 [Paxillus rubicundulus Ve08.2h10]|uniref:Unplaced genomic scaffold scaffold_1222, whole genome shotgun sequence n=1 Tax=Paxillus rubicundulus Ve08.2h10 TaxID=930991 RepID=A0A0D0DNS4_9AGAM|nr:hypothetical protein PAXRUDRAFT_36221 [Paxillus rubicundulus Ve08.2h10]
MSGNVTLYNMNTNAVMQMLEGQLMPQPATQLASVLAVMYVGMRNLPKTWLKSTFHVHCEVVYEALVWLKQNNKIYEDIIPVELSGAILHEANDEIVERERAGYVRHDDTGVSDMDLMSLLLDECMKYALANTEDSEGGYVVRHSVSPVSEFGVSPSGHPAPAQDPLAAAYPILFPYVGIKQKQHAMLSACIQMHRKDFEQDTFAINSLTVADLKQAEKEEATQIPFSNPGASYHGQIWGTCLKLRGPSLCITINPLDTHDCVVQILAREEIDMDKFFTTLGQDSTHRAANFTHDPYAAAKYFFFFIHAVLSTLFGIYAMKDQVHVTMGVLGCLKAYFGVVEAQGWGTLHVHMLLWLEDTTNCDEMHELLKSSAFQQHICEYIKKNIQAHVNGLDEEAIKNMPHETQLLITNGADTKDTMWYSTAYQSKKQSKNHNVSALMAKMLLYHETHSDYLEGTLEKNQLLIFQCQQAINWEMEMSAPQVIAYFMGWGDQICSHHYVSLYWSSSQGYLLSVFEELRLRQRAE